MTRDVFPPEHTFDLDATERYAAIREILQRLIRIGAIPSHAEEPLLAAFRQREEVMTTGVGFNIAIPHVVSDMVTERVVALGKSKSGVDFASLDGNPVNAIALMILPKSHDAATNA
jgi:mannitol/fructose-specific phosphotransferase system IIA component (Ntr-type)